MAKFSVMVGTCLNGRVPVDPLPTYYALPNPKAFVSLGDWLYHDGTDDRNSFSCDAVEFPRGSGLVLTLPAPVGGVMPTGSLTVTNGGTGHPVNRTAALIFWVRDATTGADTAWGYLTTNGSGVVTAATLIYGGRSGDYTHSGTRAFTEDTDLWTWAHPESWAYRSRRVVTATTAMRKFMALPLRRYLCPDDHELWNGGYPGAVGSKCPATVTTQAMAYAFAQTASAGVRLLEDQDFHNPAWTNPITPYVPSGLVGLGLTGTESFFKVRYFYKDYDANGNETDTPTRAVLRLIFLDCLFEKGNYTVGSDDSTRNLISPVQEAWLDAVQASAVAAGIQSIGIMSSKDRHGQNSDGWYTHTTQFGRIAANIQAKNYPTWWHTGDRHVPHAARWRVARGDPADLHIVCATALGATSDALQMYPQMDWADQSPDVPVLGSIVVDTDARVTILGVHDMGTGRAKYAVRIPFGSRVASEANTYMAAARVSRPAPSPFSPDRFTSTEFSSLRAVVSRDGILSANSAFLNMLTPDDTSAAAANSLIIYNALQAAKARGGGEVVIPIFEGAGKIWVNAAAKVPAYCTLRGITQNATLYAASTFADSRMVELGDTGDTQPPFCRVESLTLNAYGRGIWGVYSNKCQEGSGTSHVTAVQYGTGGGGFNFEDSGGLSPQNFILDDIYAYCNSAATNTVAARFVGTGVSGRVNKVTVTSSGGSAQQADGIYVSAAWMALRDVHLEAHARGLTVSTGGRVVVDFIEGYDGGGGGAPRSVTKVVSMYPDAGMCDLRGLAANGSYQLIDDQSVSPSYAVYGNGTTPGFGTAGSGTFKMNRYTNQPETMPKRTVANLPTGANVAAPARAYCSDLSGASFVFGAVAAGGGSRVGPVFWDGSNWREG